MTENHQCLLVGSLRNNGLERFLDPSVLMPLNEFDPCMSMYFNIYEMHEYMTVKIVYKSYFTGQRLVLVLNLTETYAKK